MPRAVEPAVTVEDARRRHDVSVVRGALIGGQIDQPGGVDDRINASEENADACRAVSARWAWGWLFCTNTGGLRHRQGLCRTFGAAVCATSVLTRRVELIKRVLVANAL